MDDAQKKELRALVVGYLQQTLKDRPNGFSLQEFERTFPERCEEPVDWYKRYNKNNALEALKCIDDTVTIRQDHRYNTYFVSLNLRSADVDPHLIDLITNQRQKPPSKKRGGPSSRARASFSLNSRQYSNQASRNNSHYRLNYDDGHLFAAPTSEAPFRPPNSYHNRSPYQQRSSAADYRGRPLNSSSMMVPPHVRPNSFHAPQTQRPPAPYPTPPTLTQQPPIPSAVQQQQHQQTLRHQPSQTGPAPNAAQSMRLPPRQGSSESTAQDGDPELSARKHQLRQRIMGLLTRKFAEIKLIYLNGLYSMEFDETIDPRKYGHKNLTNLMEDPILKEYIQVNYKAHFLTICARARCPANEKENLNSAKSSNGFEKNAPSNDRTNDTPLKEKLRARDPFNIIAMLKTLDPGSDIVEPPLKTAEIDDKVKYITMRMVFKASESPLKLDDWEMKFQQETRARIRVRDYGFKTALDFFKRLSQDIPINLAKNDDGEWEASANMFLISEWLHEKLTQGHYRAMTSLEMHYELIAYPDDSYTYVSPTDLITDGYLPVFVLSVIKTRYLWIQLRTPKRIEDHLLIESSLTGYEDLRSKNFLTVPKYFVKPGFPCAVYDGIQQKWCRGLVVDAPPNVDRNHKVSVLLVDYGLKREFSISELSCLLKSHQRPPVGLIYAKLHGLEDEDCDRSQKQLRKVLQEYTSPPVTLACKFLSETISGEKERWAVKKCYGITLMDTRHGKDCNLANSINESLKMQ